MPYALKNRKTSELFACTLLNVYDLPYHGVKLWPDREAAEADAPAFLAEKGADCPSDWEIVHLDEYQAKLCNVRLNNDPSRRVCLTEEGGIDIRQGAD